MDFRILNSRGLVITMDIVIASFIVLSVLNYSNELINKSDTEQWSDYDMLTTGYDIIAMLYNTGKLQEMNKTELENEISNTLPENYEMRIEIKSFENVSNRLISTRHITIGPEKEDSELQTYGKRTFLKFSGNNVETYNTVEFWIWLK